MGSGTLPRNKLSLLDRIKIVFVLIPTPVILSWALVQSFFTEDGRSRTWKRVMLDRAVLWIFSNLSRRQARALTGETRGTYDEFLKAQKRSPVVMELGDDARLLWLAPRKADRVILFLHGGAFLFSAQVPALYFWNYVQDVLAKRGKAVDVAMLNYTLVPDVVFPTQLKQAVLAIQHLIDTGVKPENIQLVGDSAGGGLIHQVFSHMLHPIEGVPELTLSKPLGGAYLMSPWTCLTDNELFYKNLGRGDILPVSAVKYWGSKVLAGIPPSKIPYLSGLDAPEDWLRSLDKAVSRIFISTGDAEILRDAIIKYAKNVEKHHKDVTFFLEAHGVHDDPFMAFATGGKDSSKLTPVIVDWLDRGFE